MEFIVESNTLSLQGYLFKNNSKVKPKEIQVFFYEVENIVR